MGPPAPACREKAGSFHAGLKMIGRYLHTNLVGKQYIEGGTRVRGTRKFNAGRHIVNSPRLYGQHDSSPSRNHFISLRKCVESVAVDTLSAIALS